MISIKKLPNKKFFFFFLFFVILATGSLYFRSRAELFTSQLNKQKTDAGRLDREKAELKKKCDLINAEYSKLQQDYTALRSENVKIAADRDNLVRRAKDLLGDSNLARTLEVKFEQANNDLEILRKENQEIIEQNLALKEEVKDLDAIKDELIKEKQKLSQQLEQEREKSGIAKLREENVFLKNENAGLNSRLKQSESESANLKLSQSKLNQEAARLNERVTQLNNLYNEAAEKNKRLEKKLTDLPARYAALAAQNKTLLKDSANMHYNLGVFYSRQKDYNRAAMEFKKCLELAPSDAQAHFNLGYIYAEHLADRAKAIEHFRQYLRHAKSGDKDIDWAKRYLITWQVWDAKDPIQ